MDFLVQGIGNNAQYGEIGVVAKARKLTHNDVDALVQRATSGRQFGILGEARVNVLKLNLALDEMKPAS